ncbi:hypothetical protein HZZ02_07785 [Streptococcus danieliae]|nr:hypothetical protein [Streptococcus danieliae]
MKISKKWSGLFLLGTAILGLTFGMDQKGSPFLFESSVVYADEEKDANEALAQLIGADENGLPKDVVEKTQKAKERSDAKEEAEKNGEEAPDTSDDATVEDYSVEKEEKEIFEPSYLSALNDLSHLTSKAYFADDIWGMSAEMNYALNKIPQAIFWVAKFFFLIFGEIYRHLNSFSNFVQYIDLALNAGSQLFQGIFGMSNYAFFALSFGITVTLAYIKFVMRGESFFVNLFRGLLPIVLLMALFVKTSNGYVMKQVYDSVSTVGTEVADSALQVTNDLRKDDTKNGDTALLDKYFDSTIWTAFKHMNADRKENDSGQLEFVLEGKFEELVYYQDGKGDFEVGDKKIKDLVGSGDKIKNHMMVDRIGDKIGIALASIFEVVAYGILIAFIGLAKFSLNIILIILLLLGVFAGLASLFPALERSIVEWFKRVFVTIFVANVLSIFGVVFLWSFDLLTQMLNQVFDYNFIVVAVLKIVIMWLVYRNRQWITGVISGGRITGDIPALRRLKRVASGRGFKTANLNPISRNISSKMSHAKSSIARKTGLAGREALALAGVGLNSFRAVKAGKDLVNSGFSYVRESTAGQLAKATREGAGVMSDTVSGSFNSLRAKAYDGKLGQQEGNETKREELLDRAMKNRASARMRKNNMNQALSAIKNGKSQVSSFNKETAKEQLSKMVVKRDQLNASKRTVKTNQSGLTKMRASSGVLAPKGFKPTTESVREKLSGATVKTSHVGNTGSLKTTSTGLDKMRSSSGLVVSKRFKTTDNDWIKLGITNQVSASDSKSFSTAGRAVEATEKLKFSEAKQVKVRSQQPSNPVNT